MPFTVDTGSLSSKISRSRLGLLGAQAFLQPCDDPRFVATVSVPVMSEKGEPIAKQFRFFVHLYDDCNVIGMDFLSSGCCVLELDPEFPLLKVHREVENTDEPYRIHAKVEVNGAPVWAFVDTGATCFATCSPQEAGTLQLPTEELEKPIPVSLLFGTGAITVRAREVQVKGLGKQAKGDVDIVPEFSLLLGMKFIQGATITFFEGGHWDITAPPRQ